MKITDEALISPAAPWFLLASSNPPQKLHIFRLEIIA